MLVRCSAVALTVMLVTTVQSVAHLAHFKRRFLEELGMEGVPDMRLVNNATSKAHLDRMTRKYWRRVAVSGRELINYQHTACSNDSLVFPTPSTDDTVQWARLRFPNSSHTSLPLSLLTSETRTTNLRLPCHRCCGATLQLRTTPARSRKKRSVQCDHRTCCRRSLTVNFREIGWDWIVQPLQFEAFYCKGRCSGGAREQFASTHALVQSMVVAKRGAGRTPCCAPRKLKALDLLHYNDKTPPELVVTRQKGMIVKQCACT